MEFHSILFPSQAVEDRAKTHPWLRFCQRKPDAGRGFVLRGNKMVRAATEDTAPAERTPELFEDVRLNLVMDEILSQEADRDLLDVFYAFCPDEHAVCYRHEVMRALEDEAVLEAFSEFCQLVERSMQMRSSGEAVHYVAQRDKYFVDGAVYGMNAVHRLLAAASGLTIRSEGLSGFLCALRTYAEKPDFIELEARTQSARCATEQISYRLSVCDGRVLLGFGWEDKDLVRETAGDFGVAGDSAASSDGDQQIRLFGQLELCPLEALVMDALKRRFPQAFRALREAAELAAAFPEPFITRFVREMRLYFRVLDLMKRMRSRGLPFAYPEISTDGEIQLEGAYDLALAFKTERVVPNDLFLAAEERGTLVTGANQAGKTTFLRSIGQIAILAALGLPVPCAHAALPLFQSVFSHFSQAEDGSTNHGRLKEEIGRLKPALQQADQSSLVLLNEPFSSTTAQDAADISHRAFSMLVDGGARVFCVSHIHGLESEHLVSMAARIDPVSHQRLYKIFRAPAERHAYADGIAQKYGLTYQEIRERVAHGI
jgi:hypothetical protein